jgi:hypothetical protein
MSIWFCWEPLPVERGTEMSDETKRVDNLEPSLLSTEEPFSRLEALMVRLDEMQEKGVCLSRAREARRLLSLREQSRILEHEYAQYQRVYHSALAAAAEAEKQGDQRTLARERGIARGYAELIATRTAPLQRVRCDLAREEEANTFASGSSAEAQDAALDEATFAALEQEIASYQQNFQETYALCKELEAEN